MPIALPRPNLLEISGPDAVAFAHAQFASDVRALAPGHWQWSAWLSAQGRVRALFRLLRTADERLLAVWWGVAAATVRDGLARYVFRSKVELRVRDGAAAGFFDAAELPPGLAPPADDVIAGSDGRFVLAVPGGGVPRWLSVGEDALPGATATSDGSVRWRLADVEAGIVDIGDELADRLVPAWLALERLGAVSVGKGCYPGQEIVARMHFRGGNKRWLHRLAFRSADLPRPGLALRSADGAEQGELVAAAWSVAPDGVALAVLPSLPARARLDAPGAEGEFRVISAMRDASD